MRLGCLVAALLAAVLAGPAGHAAEAPASSPAPPPSSAPAPAAAAAAAAPEPTQPPPKAEGEKRAQEKADAAQDRAYLIELRRPARATGRTHVQLHLVPPSVALLRPPRTPPATLVSAVLRPVMPAVSAVPVPAAAAAAGALAMLEPGALESQPHSVRASANELHRSAQQTKHATGPTALSLSKWRAPYHFQVHKPYSFPHAGASAFTPSYAAAAPTPAYTAQHALSAQIPAPAPAQVGDFRFSQLPAPAPAPAPSQTAFRWEEQHFNKPFTFQDVATESSLFSEAPYRGASSQASPFFATAAGGGGRYLSPSLASGRPTANYFARPTAAVPPPLAFHPQPAASAPAPAYTPAPLYQQPPPHLHPGTTGTGQQFSQRPAASELAPQSRPPPAAPAGPPAPPVPAPAAVQTSSPAPAPEAARSRATLRQVLQEDCPDAERLGFCASPPRYPSHQVSLAIHRCRELLNHLYVQVPETSTATSRLHENMERANREVWSWARNATIAPSGGRGAGVCASESARVLPGYARDAAGRWLVVVQAAGLVVQPATVDVCRAPGLPCPALAKCQHASGGGGGGRRGLKGAKASACEQRFTPHHVVTWDPDAPERCPKLSVAMLPTACTCRLPTDS